MDPVDQAIETYVISPLSNFLACTSEMDAVHYDYIQKFSNAVGSLFTGSKSFSGPAADTTANLAGDYFQAENRLNNSGVSQRLDDMKVLCDTTIKTLQWDMQAHWIPWVDSQGQAGSSPSLAMAGVGSIGIGEEVLGGLEATAVGAALLEALAAVAIVAAAALMQKEDEVNEAVVALAALVSAVGVLAGIAEVALPHPPALTSISVSIPAPTAELSPTEQAILAAIEVELLENAASGGYAIPVPLSGAAIENLGELLKQLNDQERAKIAAAYAAAINTAGMSKRQKEFNDPNNATLGIGFMYITDPSLNKIMIKSYVALGYKGAKAGVREGMNGHAEDYIIANAIQDINMLPKDQSGSVHLAIYTLSPACPTCATQFNGDMWLNDLYAASGGRPTFLYDWTGAPPTLTYSGEKI